MALVLKQMRDQGSRIGAARALQSHQVLRLDAGHALHLTRQDAQQARLPTQHDDDALIRRGAGLAQQGRDI